MSHTHCPTERRSPTAGPCLARAAWLIPLAALAPSLHAGGKIAIKAGRIVTLAGPDVIDGTIVIEDGRIRAIGTDVSGAWDADVLDLSGMVAAPGFVEAHTFRGMDRPNENIPVVPFLDVRDSIDPISFYFEDALRAGITTINVQQGPACVIGGQGMVVKPFGLTIEQMSVRPSAGLKLCAAPRPGRSRATQAQELRRAFTELRQHLEQLVQDKQDGNDRARREALYQGRDLESEEKKKGRPLQSEASWKVAGLENVPRGEVDEKQEPLLRLIEGQLPAFFYCDSGAAVHLALEVARANGFLAHTTLVLEGDSWKAVDAIAEAGVPVVLSSELLYVERDPYTGEEIETFVPKVFADKGVRFALQSRGSSAQALAFQAATCIGYGIEREAALASVTRTAADILRLGDRVGSLEAGKDGNVVIYDGDPLSITSNVQYVVIEGQLVYDRSKDVRMRHLLEGVEPPGTAPGGELNETHVHDDEGGEGKDAEKKDGQDEKEKDGR